jgi:hypothetical protein
MDEPKPPQREDEYVESDRDRRVANISLLVFFAALVGAGIWLVNAMFEQRQLDDCIAQGRTNCAPRIDAPAR